MSIIGKYSETADQQSLRLGVLGDEESLLIDMQFLFWNHENDLNFIIMMAVLILCEYIETTELGILSK